MVTFDGRKMSFDANLEKATFGEDDVDDEVFS